MEKFQTRAHIDEFVLGGDDVGTFSASADRLMYTRPGDVSPTSIPLTEIETIQFERNTTLHHMKFLGVSSVILAFVLTLVPSINIYLQGLPKTQTEALLFGFIYLFAIGAWSTAYDYLSVGNHDIIDLYIRTADEAHIICGSLDNTTFVHACEQLIDSDISTTNQNAKLSSKIS